MSTRVGVLEWMENTQPVKDFIQGGLSPQDADSYHRMGVANPYAVPPLARL
jgi:hypothetical protein